MIINHFWLYSIDLKEYYFIFRDLLFCPLKIRCLLLFIYGCSHFCLCLVGLNFGFLFLDHLSPTPLAFIFLCSFFYTFNTILLVFSCLFLFTQLIYSAPYIYFSISNFIIDIISLLIKFFCFFATGSF